LILLFTFETEFERDKFEQLYNKYNNLLFYKAWEILHDYMLAEDAVSEAYMRLYRNLHKVDDDPDSPRSAAFLVTIVRNVALTMVKRAGAETADAFEEDRPDTFDLEGMVLSEISSERIYAILGGLDEELRNIFVLKFAYDMQHREIAETLGITENNVTVKLHRAKKKLAEILEKEGYVRG
jgi:RNA polymerase sigma factor, sigma-70 family